MPAAEPPLGRPFAITGSSAAAAKPAASSGPDRPGHGPYWFAVWHEGGLKRSRYLGRNAPPGVEAAEPPAPPAPDSSRAPDALPALGDAAFAAAWKAGRGLTLEEAITETTAEPRQR